MRNDFIMIGRGDDEVIRREAACYLAVDMQRIVAPSGAKRGGLPAQIRRLSREPFQTSDVAQN